jgi:polyisoprenyl-phosphate glycosyltransferase
MSTPEDDVEISVVSPVYRAERILPDLCARLDAVLAGLAARYEIVLVDDRSPDRSWAVLQELAGRYPRLLAVRLSRNFGQHYAITAGLDLARGEHVVVMDCDLQDLPEDIPRLMARAREGCDVVLARRIVRADSAFKRAGSAVFYRVFALLSGYEMDARVGTFRVLHRRVVQALGEMRESYRFFGALVEWLGFSTGYVDVQHAARPEGRSTYDLKRLLRLTLDGMVSFSNRPLTLSVGLGALISCLAALYGCYLIGRYLTEGAIPVQGWMSTVVILSFMSGLILFNLGIVGVYLGRIYNQTKGRPLYVVDRIVGGGAERAESLRGHRDAKDGRRTPSEQQEVGR